MRSHLQVTDPAADLALAPIEALRVAAGLAANDTSRDTQLTSLGLRIAAEIADACGIVTGDGGEPTLRREELTETFPACNAEVLILSRRHQVEIISVTQDGEAITLDARSTDAEAGILERWIDGIQTCWRAREIVVVYEAGFDLTHMPANLVGAVEDLVRIRLSEGSHDPLDKAITIEIPDVETVRRDRWLGALPGASKSGGLPADITARLGRFMNSWVA